MNLFALLVLAGLSGVALATAVRPFVGCMVFVMLVPLTAGLSRGLGVPGLRLSEALALAVAVGVLVHRLLRPHAQPTSMLDVAVAAFVGGTVLVPAFVLWGTTRADVGNAVWAMLAPGQYLAVYFIFSRAPLARGEVRQALIAALVVSCAVATIGVLQLIDAGGVRGWIGAWYPPSASGFCSVGYCRPTSLLQHWSAFGAYSLMHYALALALMGTPSVRMPRLLLFVAAAVNGLGVVASQTQAVLLMLPLVTAIVAWHRGRLPRDFWRLVALGCVGAVALWPVAGPRLMNQVLYGNGISTPESMLTRYRFWTELFVPNALDRLLWGSGTVVPASVPTRFVHFVDNEYLSLVFRAGVVGLSLFAAVLVTMAAVSLRGRRRASLRGALGAALLAHVVALALMGATAEYSTFGGVSQTLWMTAGLMSTALVVPRMRESVQMRLGPRAEVGKVPG